MTPTASTHSWEGDKHRWSNGTVPDNEDRQSKRDWGVRTMAGRERKTKTWHERAEKINKERGRLKRSSQQPVRCRSRATWNGMNGIVSK